MTVRLPILSLQMQAILLLLEREGPMAARQINGRLYPLALQQNRRAFAASMSRTIRRMEWRGLVVRDSGQINITDTGLFRIHPEQFQAVLDEIGKAVRDAVHQAFAQSMPSELAITGNRKDAV